MKTFHRAPRLAALTGAAILSLVALSPAAAQDGGSRGWLVTIGAGPQVGPKYPGADSYGFSPMPIFGLRRPGDPLPVASPDQSFGFGLLGRDSVVDLGPVVHFIRKRDPADVGAPVAKVGIAVEVGGFVNVSPVPWLRLRAEGRKAVTGHDGWNGDVAADFVARPNDRTIITFGPRARIADHRYHQAYYGVTPAIALATGLPAYSPGGGVHAIGVNAGLTHEFSSSWGMYAYAGYDRLVGDAADSPIVRALGSRDQFSGGIGISYTFQVGGRR
jgi:outer membrane protein